MGRSMPRMLRALSEEPDKGLLGFRMAWIGGPAAVQYWSSFDALDRFAKNPQEPHLPMWRWYNRAIKASGDVGIWHETYVVPAGKAESIYGNMPRVGLAAATTHVLIRRKGNSAAYRIGNATTDQAAVKPYETPDTG